MHIARLRLVTHGCHGGYTLVEVMVSLVLFSITTAAVYGLYRDSVKAHVSQELAVELAEDLRAAMELMSHEVRMAGYTGVGGGFDPAAALGFLDDADDRFNTDANSIHFSLDIGGGDTAADDHEAEDDDDDGDGRIDEPGESDGNLNDPGELICYYRYESGGIAKLGRCSGELCRGGGGGAPSPVLEHLTEIHLRYFDRRGQELLPPFDARGLEAIRSVEIRLSARSARPDPFSHHPRHATLVQRVRVRNAGLAGDLQQAFSF